MDTEQSGHVLGPRGSLLIYIMVMWLSWWRHQKPKIVYIWGPSFRGPENSSYILILLRSALFLKCSNSGKNESLEMKFDQKLRINRQKQCKNFWSIWILLRLVPPGFPRFLPYFGPVSTSNWRTGWPERLIFGPDLGPIGAPQTPP